MEERDFWEYDFMLEKKLLKWINNQDGVLRRKDIYEYAQTIGVPDRTLSDWLKKFVKSSRLYRIKQGNYININNMSQREGSKSPNN